MELNMIWEQYIKDNGAEFVYFVDTSTLPAEAVYGYTCAILFGKVLTREYLSAIRAGQKPKRQEFGATEHKMDALADKLAEQLVSEGHDSVSKLKVGTLPHKTIALRAGLGFIGKNTLLVNDQYGCALVLGKVLTTAPFATTAVSPKAPQCGDCRVCVDVCPTKALHGKTWSVGTTRDEMLVRKNCSCCLKCMIWCPYTVKYAEHLTLQKCKINVR